jgi:hypothetical protein
LLSKELFCCPRSFLLSKQLFCCPKSPGQLFAVPGGQN